VRIALGTVGDWIAVLSFVDATHGLSASRTNPHDCAYSTALSAAATLALATGALGNAPK